jgi:sulfide:quinone oxidoreductase
MADRPFRVVIAGTGIAGLETALNLRELAGRHVEMTLVGPGGDVYQQGLPSDAWSLGGLARIPVAAVARRVDAQLVSGWLAAVDDDRAEARLNDGSVIGYDALVVAVGARRSMAFDRGAVMYGGRLDVDAVERVLEHVRRGLHGRFAVAVPPGAGWTLPAHELAIRVAEAAPAAGPAVTLLTYERTPAEVFGDVAAGAVAEMLVSAGVRVRTEAIVADVERHQLCFADGGRLAFSALVALPYLRGPRIPGLPTDPDGYVVTGPRGEVAGRVFAAGDATDFPVKQGGLATQQAEVAAASVAALAGLSEPPKPLHAVLRGVLPVRERCLHLERDLVTGRSRVDRTASRPSHRVAGGRLQNLLDSLATVPAGSPDL